MMKSTLRIIAPSLLALAGIAFASPALAFTFRTGSMVTVNDSAPIQGSLFVSGQNITIDSQINGDLYCAGQNVVVTGLVQGDIICAAQTLAIDNTTQGNVRSAAQTISLRGAIAKNATVAGQHVEASGDINGELMAAGQTASAGGKIGGSAMLAAKIVNVSGNIGREAIIYADQASLAANSAVGGNIDYYSNNVIQQASGSSVKGQITRHQPPAPPASQPKPSQSAAEAWLYKMVFSIAANLVLGLLLVLFFGRTVAEITAAGEKPWRHTGFGLLLFVSTPIIILLLFISVFGILSGVVLGMVYALALILARIFAAIAAGRLILRAKQDDKGSLCRAAAVGIIAGWFIFSIPAIGWIISLVAFSWGFGQIWQVFFSMKKEGKGNMLAAPPAGR